MSSDRVTFELTPEARQHLDDLIKRYPLVKKQATARLFTWFSQQDEMLQSIILGLVPDSYRGDVLTLLYERHHGHGTAAQAAVELDQAAKRASKGRGGKRAARASA